MAWGDKQRAIADYIVAHPRARNIEIAAALGLSPAYVSTVRQRFGFPTVKRLHSGDSCYVAAHITPAQRDWLERTKPEGVSMSAHIASIITDAMYEGQEHG